MQIQRQIQIQPKAARSSTLFSSFLSRKEGLLIWIFKRTLLCNTSLKTSPPTDDYKKMSSFIGIEVNLLCQEWTMIVFKVWLIPKIFVSKYYTIFLLQISIFFRPNSHIFSHFSVYYQFLIPILKFPQNFHISTDTFHFPRFLFFMDEFPRVGKPAE